MPRITAYKLAWNITQNKGKIRFLVEGSDDDHDLNLDAADFSAIAAMLSIGRPATIHRDGNDVVIAVGSGAPD
jgi:hypothetical protein